jgi:hypothetical protein
MTIEAWGVDYSMGYDIATLTKYNAKFACRYIGFTSSSLPQDKILQFPEVEELSNAGISIVSNWEWTGNPNKEGMGIGIWTAQHAAQLHADLGGPSNKPIYFSIDYNSPGSDVAWYFQEIASIIGLARVGAYGGYNCIKYLLDHNLITWAWQTYAWSGTQLDSRVHIYQYLNGSHLDNMTLDYDNALRPDYGQWSLKPLIIIGGGDNKFMEQQFDTLWFNQSNIVAIPPGYQSGIYIIVKAGFMARKYSACYQTSLEVDNVDWAGSPIKMVTLSNGMFVAYADGQATVYDQYNKPVYQGHL